MTEVELRTVAEPVIRLDTMSDLRMDSATVCRLVQIPDLKSVSCAVCSSVLWSVVDIDVELVRWMVTEMVLRMLANVPSGGVLEKNWSDGEFAEAEGEVVRSFAFCGLCQGFSFQRSTGAKPGFLCGLVADSGAAASLDSVASQGRTSV